jgi:hypothetical protein
MATFSSASSFILPANIGGLDPSVATRRTVNLGGNVLTVGGLISNLPTGGFVPPFVFEPPPTAPPPQPAPPPPSPTANASDLQVMISAIPTAQDGQVITADFHNALRLALVAIANQLGIGPVSDEITVTNAPRLSPMAGAVAWDHDVGLVRKPQVVPAGNVRGWMEVELPHGARIKKMVVFGTTSGTGTLKIRLRRQQVTDPTVFADLIVIEIPDGFDVTKGAEGDVTLPGTGASSVAIESFRLVDNRQQKYLLTAELDGVDANTTAQFHCMQIVCGQ